MLNRIRELLTPPDFEGDEEKARVARLLNGLLWSLLALSVIAAPPMIILSDTASGRIFSIATVAVVSLPTLGLLWVMRRGRPLLASTLFLTIMLILFAANTFFYGGIRNTMTAGYLLIIVMASLLLDRRGALAFGVATLLTVFGLFWVERTYAGFPPLAPHVSIGDFVIFFAIFVLMAVLMSFALHDLTQALRRARRGEEDLEASNRELRANRDALQTTMRDLRRRNEQVRLASEIARDAAAAQDLEQILERAASLIQTRFNLYHTGLFLLDDRHQYAVLRAAAGHGAEEALARGFWLRVGEQGTVGDVTATGRSYLVRDVREDPIYVEHPLSAEVRSEVMLPLRAGDEVIGAIGCQSREVDAFDEDDVAVLQIMADQLAVAIENARLLDEMEEAVRELELASGRYTRELWRAADRGPERTPGYRYRRLGVEPAHKYPSEAREAWRQGRSVVTTRGGDGHGETSAAAIPIKLREQVIGVFRLSSEERAISPETLSLVEEAADRLSLALENARLLEETQRRAERERLSAEISSQVWGSADIDTILRTAVRELGKTLRASDARIELGIENGNGASRDVGQAGDVGRVSSGGDGGDPLMGGPAGGYSPSREE